MNKQFKNLSLWLGVALLATALVLAGCGGKDAKKDTFIFALQNDAVNLDPQMGIDSQSLNVTSRKVFETLVTTDKNNKIIPELATEWKQINPTTWEFTLRKGVKFHDGTDFNAQAVKTTLDRVLDPKANRARRSVYSAIKEVKVIADDKIQLITDGPYAPLLINLAHPGGSMISPKAIEEDVRFVGGDSSAKALAANPVGTGPFKFVSWTKGQEVKLDRFDGYWGKKPTVAHVIFKTVPEDATRMAMVKTGEAQAAEQVPLTDVERIGKDSNLQLIRNTGYRVEFLAFNVTQPPFDNPKVRQAVSEALDFPAILQGVYSGVGKSDVSPLGPDVFGYNPNLKPYPHNLEHAKQLLAEAGYPNGLKATLITADRKIRIKLAEVIQAQLKPIGIDLEIQPMEFGAYIKATVEAKHQLSITGWSNQTGDGDYALTPSFTAAGFASGSNTTRYDNPDVNALLKQARQELNVEKRKAIYGKIQEIIYEDRPVLVTQFTEFLTIAQKNVKGLWVTPGGIIVLSDLEIE